MSFYFTKVPSFVKQLFPQFVWKISLPSEEKKVFLTFDDGPFEASTNEILTLLDKIGAKATFFLTGLQAERHPELVKLIALGGHLLGNHGFDHRDPLFMTPNDFRQHVEWTSNRSDITRLYRPPYGRLRPGQWNWLRKKYHIVQWTLMPGDFDRKRPISKVLELFGKVESGDIIVLHDNPSCIKRLVKVLPEALDILSDSGYSLVTLNNLLPHDNKREIQQPV